MMAGLAGFEPTNAGIKNRCLTTWRQPNMLFLKCGFTSKLLLFKRSKAICLFQHLSDLQGSPINPCGALTLFRTTSKSVYKTNSSFVLSRRRIAIENGALGEIRTHDLCLRRATLYPAELQVQVPRIKSSHVIRHFKRNCKFFFMDFFDKKNLTTAILQLFVFNAIFMPSLQNLNIYAIMVFVTKGDISAHFNIKSIKRIIFKFRGVCCIQG